MLGRIVLTVKDGLCCSVHSQTSCSPCAFEAEYTDQESGVGPQASSIDLRFQDLLSIWYTLSMILSEAEVEDDVYTKVLRFGSLAAALKALDTEAMTRGITFCGSGLRETSLAAWMKPLQPKEAYASTGFPGAVVLVLTLHSFIKAILGHHVANSDELQSVWAILLLEERKQPARLVCVADSSSNSVACNHRTVSSDS